MSDGRDGEVVSVAVSGEYWAGVGGELEEMRAADLFCDVTLEARGGSLRAHRVVLSVHSATLKARLRAAASGDGGGGAGTAAGTGTVVSLENLELPAVRAVVEFLYTGAARFDRALLGDVLEVAHSLGVPLLRDLCVGQVAAMLRPDNALTWLELACRLGLREVKARCLNLIAENFHSISRQPEFAHLSLSNVHDCIQHVQERGRGDGGAGDGGAGDGGAGDGGAGGCSEDVVLRAAMQWVSVEQVERGEHLDSLLEHVRLDGCSLAGIMGVLREHKALLREHEAAYDRLTMAAEQLATAATTATATATEPTSPSKATLVIVGGQTSESDMRGVWWRLDEEKHVDAMLRIPFSELKRRHSACRSDAGFIVSGGEDSTLCVQFTAATGKWARLPDLTKHRHRHGSATIAGVLFLVAGHVAGRCSKSVHSLNIGDGGRWKEEADMPDSVKWPKVAVLANDLYALDESNCKLYRNDGERRLWSQRASLQGSHHYGIAIAPLNGKLYAVARNIAACYTPDTDSWVACPHKPQRDHMYGPMVAHDGKLLILGGSLHGGADEIEQMDNGVWAAQTWKMPAPLYHHHAMVLHLPHHL